MKHSKGDVGIGMLLGILAAILIFTFLLKIYSKNLNFTKKEMTGLQKEVNILKEAVND